MSYVGSLIADRCDFCFGACLVPTHRHFHSWGAAWRILCWTDRLYKDETPASIASFFKMGLENSYVSRLGCRASARRKTKKRRGSWHRQKTPRQKARARRLIKALVIASALLFILLLTCCGPLVDRQYVFHFKTVSVIPCAQHTENWTKHF